MRDCMTMGGRWTASEEERLSTMLAAGHTRRECADAIGRTIDSVKRAMVRLGLRSLATGAPAQRPPLPHGYHDSEYVGDMPRQQSASGSTAGLYPAGPGPSPGAGSDATAPELLELATFCRSRQRSLEDVCERFRCPPSGARQLLNRARAAGYTIDLAGDALAWRAPEDVPSPTVETVALRPVTGDRFVVAVCADLHFGSKYCMREALADYMRQVYADGARICLVAGDILDGCYQHGRWELSHHGWDEQARDALESLPQLEGMRYYAIDGNHDTTFWAESGMVSGQRLVEYFSAHGRTDVTYLGSREGRLSLRMLRIQRPVLVELWHPRPHKAYALSYQMQKRIEAYAPGTKPDVLICGHWHTALYLETRGIHALAAGCFQSPESSFARSLVGGVSCGGWSLSWQATTVGTLRRVRAERWAYYHREDARAVELESVA